MNKILSFGVGVMVLCGGLEAGGAESGLANWLAQYQWTLHGEKAEVVREPENGDFRIRSSASAGAAVLKSELIPLQGVSERQINAKIQAERPFLRKNIFAPALLCRFRSARGTCRG